MNALNIVNFVFGIFIDLQKTFDTVDDEILLNKLNFHGIRSITNQWFYSYLTNQKQYVPINGSDSNVSTITCGAPQGSDLGSLLFLIYINHLYIVIRHGKVFHFADDTNLFNVNILI